MRRRRLALRQIEETAQDVSDSDEQNEGDDATHKLAQQAEEPNFNLFGTAVASGAAGGRVTTSTIAILLSDEDDDMGGALPLQAERTSTSRRNSSKKAKAKSATDDRSNGGVEDSNRIFQLYQEGLTSDQILQLAFIRRRVPRSLQKKSVTRGEEFVLPHPTVSVKDLLPAPSDSINLRDLFTSQQKPSLQPLSSATSKAHSSTASSVLPNEVADRLASARKYFFTPEEAPLEERHAWSVITESGWNQLHKELQAEDVHTKRLASLTAICTLLRDCRSDALARFIWEKLLVALFVENCSNPGEPELLQIQELLTALLRQEYFQTMAPKDFRAAVRAKNLRHAVNGDALGAQLELQLLTVYHQLRQQK
ncbi:hypothetical protein FI667_g15205, partial [Globisporangium splendens]